MSDPLAVQSRPTRGKRRARRQRIAGQIPAVLYGHGEEVLSLSVNATAMQAIIRHGSRLVELTGVCQERALIREVQWDPFGNDVLHVDFARISADERVSVTLRVELKGTAIGIKDGGIVQHVLHEVEIECPAGLIPDKLVLNVNQLALDASLTAAAIELPAGAKLLSAADAVVALCEKPMMMEDMAEAAPGSVEPELIGRKPGEEEGEGEEA